MFSKGGSDCHQELSALLPDVQDDLSLDTDGPGWSRIRSHDAENGPQGVTLGAVLPGRGAGSAGDRSSCGHPEDTLPQSGTRSPMGTAARRDMAVRGVAGCGGRRVDRSARDRGSDDADAHAGIRDQAGDLVSVKTTSSPPRARVAECRSGTITYNNPAVARPVAPHMSPELDVD